MSSKICPFLSVSFVFVIALFLPPRFVNAADPTMASAAKSSGPDVKPNAGKKADGLPTRTEMDKMDLKQLKDKLEDVTKSIPQTAEQTQKLQVELYNMRQAARSNEKIVTLLDQIEAMKKKVEVAIDQLPEVKAKMDELATDKKKLSVLMNLRVELMGLVAAAEQKPKKAAGEGQ